MPDGFPCPNPTCTHTFPPEAVKGSDVLTCPRCGTVYKFRQPAGRPLPPVKPPDPPPTRTVPSLAAERPSAKAAPRPPAKAPPAKAPPPLPPRPKAPPPPPVPMAAPVAPAVPLASPVRAERAPDPSLRLESSPDMVLSPAGRRGRHRRGAAEWIRLGVGVAFILAITGAVVYGIYWAVGYKPPDDQDDTPSVRKARGNFELDAPAGWRRNAEVQRSFDVNLAMSRAKPANNFALAYHDYRTRTPGDAELLDEALKKLRRQFGKVEYEDPFAAKDKGRSGKLGGEPAIFFDFQATSKDETETWPGQAVMLTRRGYAYWLFAWGPESAGLKDGWANVRERFTFFDDRAGWKPLPRETQAFASEKGFRLDYVTWHDSDKKLPLWRKEETPTDYDDRCEFALKGFEPTEDQDTGKTRVINYAGKLATALFFVLDHKGDDKDFKSAQKAAEEYLHGSLTKQKTIYPNLKFEPEQDPKSKLPEVSPDVGGLRGQVAYLKVMLDAENERYGVLGVARLTEDKILVVFCECKYDRMTFWKQEFKNVIESLRRAGG